MASLLPVREMVASIPAKDVEASKRFYAELFTVNWTTENLCQVQAGNSRFLIQNHYQKEWAENSMYQLLVEDAQAIWDLLQSSGVLTRNNNVRANPPKQEAWGNVVYMWGPAGELWHLTEGRKL